MLYLVGLPVGNWQDMPLRNIEMIKAAKHLVIENEHAYKELLKNLNIQKDIEPLYINTMDQNAPYAEAAVIPKIIGLLRSGEDVYVISDDGMPGIADPGEMITRELISEGLEFTATPGPSAIIVAASLAGCQHNFSFEAFLPLDKKTRSREIQTKVSKEAPMIFMLRNIPDINDEISEVLEEMQEKWGNRTGVLCYNLTTNKEKVIRGSILELKRYHLKHTVIEDMVMLVVDGSKSMLSMPEV